MKEIFDAEFYTPKEIGQSVLDKLTHSQTTRTESEAISRTQELAHTIDHSDFLTRMVVVGGGILKFGFRAITNPDSVKIYTDAIRSLGKDDLTGLSNRARFVSQLEQEIQTEGSHAIMMFDLINFSEINNKHGQLVGDEFLQLFADALRANFRGDRQDDLLEYCPFARTVNPGSFDDLVVDAVGKIGTCDQDGKTIQEKIRQNITQQGVFYMEGLGIHQVCGDHAAVKEDRKDHEE